MSDLFVGIDIGKSSHAISLISQPLLQRFRRYDRCPHMRIDNSRAGFEELLKAIRRHADPASSHALMEHTGHYGSALEQFLQEHGLVTYRINAPERYGKDKTDKRDAQALAVILYNQVHLGQIVEGPDKISRLIHPSSTVRILRGIVQHRSELVRETTRRKNKLTSICDEMFPELTLIYKDPNGPSALALRMKYPLPQSLIDASISEICATRTHTRPSKKALIHLQELAKTTIGTKDPYRQKSLIIEQEQLIVELALLEKHIDRLETEIEPIIAESREGQILTSFIGIGPTHAAIILCKIGNITNFETPAKLRGYAGWSPKRTQTGTTYDNVKLDKGGNGLLRHTLYLVALSAIKHDPRWKHLYNRLVPLKCPYNAQKKKYTGKKKVVGRITGQLIKVIFLLLKRDHDLLASLAPGEAPPPPELYDPLYMSRASALTHQESEVPAHSTILTQ